LAYFSDLNSNIKEIQTLLLSDQTLCKLLYYGEPDWASKADISATPTLKFTHLFPLPKIPTSENEKKSMLNFYFIDSKPQSRNPGFRNVVLCFDVICHIDIWQINEGIRPYAISNRIDRMFNGQFYENLGIGDVSFDSWVNMRYGDYYYGYRLLYKVGKDSHVGCETT